jgi:hypothetical protein
VLPVVRVDDEGVVVYGLHRQAVVEEDSGVGAEMGSDGSGGLREGGEGSGHDALDEFEGGGAEFRNIVCFLFGSWLRRRLRFLMGFSAETHGISIPSNIPPDMQFLLTRRWHSSWWEEGVRNFKLLNSGEI